MSMTSSKLILIFLAFIFLLIIILSSNKIASSLRSRFGNLLPSISPISEDITPTPVIEEVITSTPTPTVIYGKNSTKTNSSVKSIPASGPADLAWLLLGGSFASGVILKKLSSKNP